MDQQQKYILDISWHRNSTWYRKLKDSFDVGRIYVFYKEIQDTIDGGTTSYDDYMGIYIGYQDCFHSDKGHVSEGFYFKDIKDLKRGFKIDESYLRCMQESDEEMRRKYNNCNCTAHYEVVSEFKLQYIDEYNQSGMIDNIDEIFKNKNSLAPKNNNSNDKILFTLSNGIDIYIPQNVARRIFLGIENLKDVIIRQFCGM